MEKIQQQTGNFLRNSNNDRLQSSTVCDPVTDPVHVLFLHL